jgi:futalosine hydrolase
MSFLGFGRVLVMTAVEAEREAVLRGLGAAGCAADVFVETGGVGVAATAAATARLLALAEDGFDALLSAGIAGGVTGRVAVGGTVVATSSIAADLGADSADGFVSLDRLGFGRARLDADPRLLAAATSALPHAVAGPVLTVSTVTGTEAGVREVLARHPDAVAEAMEGFGVATAAAQVGLPFGEVRTISNPMGPRDRAAWRIGDALDGLSEAFASLAKLTM